MRARTFLASLLLAASAVSSVAAAASECPPAGWSQEQLAALKAAKFAVEVDAKRQELALALVPCLSSPDAVLRDGIAFEAFSTWLRAGKVDAPTRAALLQQLLPALADDAADEDGFRQPFSALVLAELARVDRKSAYLSTEERMQLVDAGVHYLESVRDYRGFDPEHGWRHGVAHGSDLLMQLALNEAVGKPELDRILAAVRSQVAPAGEHSYIHGESERLARPVLLTAMRGLHSADEWATYFKQIAAPAPLADWGQAFQSTAGLARRHNTRAFLLLMHAELVNSKNEKLAPLLPAVNAALVAMQ